MFFRVNIESVINDFFVEDFPFYLEHYTASCQANCDDLCDHRYNQRLLFAGVRIRKPNTFKGVLTW